MLMFQWDLELPMRGFGKIYAAGRFRVGIDQNNISRWTRWVRGMRKMYSPSCVFVVVLILSSFGASWEEKSRKKGSYSVPLLRTKRDLRDSSGNPTENLKGRPGQGYYIATDLGSPAQRVSIPIIYCSQCLPCDLSPTNILAFHNPSFILHLLKRPVILSWLPLMTIVVYQFWVVLYRTNVDFWQSLIDLMAF